MRTVVAFDFDGTLTRRDSVVPFLWRFCGRGTAAIGLLRNLPALFAAASRRDRDCLRAGATQALLSAVSDDLVARRARAHAERIVEHGLRPDTVARLRWHLEQGHEVVIVSASYTDYVEPVAAHLGVDAVLATRLERDAGVTTGRLDGPNCRGEEKVNRLTSWLACQGWERDDLELWAYGDSGGDRQMLDFADYSIWVGGRLDSVAPIP